MIQLNSDLFYVYSTDLVSRVYKILPLYEENNIGLSSYIQSLIFELYGVYEVVEDIHNNSHFVSLIATLESLSEEVLSNDHRVIKREVFRSIELVKKLAQSSLSGVPDEF
ncbi:hypothetical protein M5X17_27435 [Paenibacillus alvei]|uniref:hypothetical protein n=1 Tax=Paenibacillus alvei TaxID=44250 RepID=UPI0022810912|nr:hypothetical protein [Paenibacillus alvei]MCY9737438.1 hypothetical protein [Paenibacillus alvei]